MPGAAAVDPENILVSHMPLRRMDAEQLYDSILEVSGRLDNSQFGPPVAVDTRAGGEIVAKGKKEMGWRRAIYTLQRRTTPMTMLEVFRSSRRCRRIASSGHHSTVPTQALQMMNSGVVRDHARYLGRPSD